MKRLLSVLSSRFSHLVHTAIATGTLALPGCAVRPVPGETGGATGDGSGSGETGGSPTGGNPTGGNPTGGDPTGGDPTGGNPTGGDPTGGDPTGGNPDPTEPPRLIDADFVDFDTLRLTFSEPIAPVDGVDPQKFRLSAAFGRSGGYYYEYEGTQYMDVGYFASEEYCYEYCPYWTDVCYEYCYPYGPFDPIRAIGIANVAGDPSRVDLTLSPPLGNETCQRMSDRFGYGYGQTEMGIFVHYSNNRSPVVLDLDGQQLEPIAEHWALTPTREFDYLPGFFPNMDPFIPIPCP